MVQGTTWLNTHVVLMKFPIWAGQDAYQLRKLLKHYHDFIDNITMFYCMDDFVKTSNEVSAQCLSTLLHIMEALCHCS